MFGPIHRRPVDRWALVMVSNECYTIKICVLHLADILVIDWFVPIYWWSVDRWAPVMFVEWYMIRFEIGA